MISIYQGDTFTISTPLFDDDGVQKDITNTEATALVAKYGQSKATIEKPASKSDNQFVVTFSESDTIDKAPGLYQYQLRTDQGVVLVELITIKPIIRGD